MRLSGGILCALCLGAHDRRFTRSRSGSGSQAKPSSAEEQAARCAGHHPRTLRGCLPSSHRPRRNCARRCRRRIRAADSGPSYPFHRCCGYDGQWFNPLRKALSAFVTSTQEHVTGKVRLELYRSNLINAGVWSPYSLYREDIATFAAGGDYKQSDAAGFISIYGLPTKVQAIVNSEKEEE